MGHYVPHTDAELASMLEFVGLSSLDDLFTAIPEALSSSKDAPRGPATGRFGGGGGGGGANADPATGDSREPCLRNACDIVRVTGTERC